MAARLVVAALVQLPLAAVMAWEPQADADANRSGDPGWYRAGETPQYGADGTGYASGGRSNAGYPDAKYPDAAYPDTGYPNTGNPDTGYQGSGYPGSGAGRTPWGSASGGYGQPSVPQSGVQPAPGAVHGNWPSSGGWPARAAQHGNNDWDNAPARPHYPDAASGVYRFRGDGEARDDWTAPYWRGGPQPADRFRGYRFREDEHLDARMQRGRSDSRYRYRPLESDEGDADAGPGRGRYPGYAPWPGYDFRPDDAER